MLLVLPQQRIRDPLNNANLLAIPAGNDMRAAPDWACALWRLVVSGGEDSEKHAVSTHYTVAKAPAGGQAGAARRYRRAEPQEPAISTAQLDWIAAMLEL